MYIPSKFQLLTPSERKQALSQTYLANTDFKPTIWHSNKLVTNTGTHTLDKSLSKTELLPYFPTAVMALCFEYLHSLSKEDRAKESYNNVTAELKTIIEQCGGNTKTVMQGNAAVFFKLLESFKDANSSLLRFLNSLHEQGHPAVAHKESLAFLCHSKVQKAEGCLRTIWPPYTNGEVAWADVIKPLTPPDQRGQCVSPRLEDSTASADPGKVSTGSNPPQLAKRIDGGLCTNEFYVDKKKVQELIDNYKASKPLSYSEKFLLLTSWRVATTEPPCKIVDAKHLLSVMKANKLDSYLCFYSKADEYLASAIVSGLHFSNEEVVIRTGAKPIKTSPEYNELFAELRLLVAAESDV